MKRRRRTNLNKSRVCHSIFLFLISLLACQIPIGANALDLTDKWRQLSPQEFESFRLYFAPYEIKAHRNDIWILGLSHPIVLRIESSDFCRKSLCLTIVTLACGRSICPSTTVFAGKEATLERRLWPIFGGTRLLTFPRPKDRMAVVMVAEKFVSAVRSFEE